MEEQTLDLRSSEFNFSVSLKGSNEVPAVDTKASGQAIIRISEDETSVYYKLIVVKLEGVTAAHFPLGSSGSTGPVVAFLYPPQAPGGPVINGVLTEGVIREGDLLGPLVEDFDALIEAIREGQIYVNVHTNTYRLGELRGNL